MRELRCREARFDCEAVVQGQSDEEILAQVGWRAEQVYGVTVTPEMPGQPGGVIHDV